MIEQEHLQVYPMVLTVKSPLFVGSGREYSKQEYLYNRDTRMLSVLHQEKFLKFLQENNLVDAYERFVLGRNSDLHSFLHYDCRVSENVIRSLCIYTLEDSRANDKQYRLRAFQRDNQYRAYVPGSTIKGALRTVLLYDFIQKQGAGEAIHYNNNYPKQITFPEKQYLNTLQYKNSRESISSNNEVTSILQGVRISDSLPISDSCFTLATKLDICTDGSERIIPTIREALKPETKIFCTLTLDQSILHEKVTKDSIFEAMKAYNQDYRTRYEEKFRLPQNVRTDITPHSLRIGGGAGYFSKTLVYPYEGDKVLQQVSDIMTAMFPKHYHQQDVAKGISPHTLKYTSWNGQRYPFGICEVEFL